MASLLTGVPQPLAYAEALLAQYGLLAQASNSATLLGDFVHGLACLSGCELTQLYLLDATHSCLLTSAECLDGTLGTSEVVSLPLDHSANHLLQFSLCQNQAVCLGELGNGQHEIGFLPGQVTAWQSLLIVPLNGPGKAVKGLLLCASRRCVDLHCFADSLGQLGTFMFGQLHLLQRLQNPAGHGTTAAAVISGASSFGLTSKSASMRRTCTLIGKVVHNAYTVLLGGETGTGKEVVARVIHDFGPRRTQPFIVQNCAALPENLLESELFGYRKGAFTGADRDRVGLFDAAHGGTLLLDEIGDMPLSLQAKLLRVLQENEIRPLGSSKSHKVDVRIIAATHCDLLALVGEGRFRQDLYYRLAQFPIELPALRQRRDDIPELARHFAEKTCALLCRPPVQCSDAVLDLLAIYPFPGNVRELKTLVERAVLLCEGDELRPAHFLLDDPDANAEKNLTLRQRLEKMERRLLLDCLRGNRGNQTHCARELGLPRRTLIYRLRRLNINLDEWAL